MASYGHQIPPRAHPGHSPSPHGGHGGYAPQAVAAPGVPGAPAGTFASGTKIQVGSHRVIVQKYLSEGGFAHVYLVKLPKPIDGTDQAVLKRVAVPDKEALRGMRTEVETMKRLKGHRPIVTYIDSHASELKGGGYEVFLLMEYCSGGGLIDFMNTRLQHRLTEPEIIKIFSDIAEGVACMHYLKPPLLHRDLKIENVLITTSKGSTKRFKLCDFGSTAPPRPAPTSVVECRLMEEDVQRHTTLQYRSPEMVDVYRKQPLNEKSDIWALGVFLYKLCYYTTPFEDQGQLAILNASYRFPSSPPFSDRLKRLIASMLKENMQSRPNIYQVLKEACAMQNREVPIPDIYSSEAKAASRTQDKTGSSEQPKSQPAVGAVWSPPAEEEQKIPDVVPMRRGRPTAAPPAVHTSQSAAPSSRGTSGDPFAALDSKTSPTDDFSSRFPSLDQFSLLHDSGAKFDFANSPTSPQSNPKAPDDSVAQRLADEAFASSRSPPPSAEPLPRVHSVPPTRSSSSKPPKPSVIARSHEVSRDPSQSRKTSEPTKQDISRAQAIISSNPELQAISSQTTAKYVSTGTSTTDLPSYEAPTRNSHRVSQVIPGSPRSSSIPRQSDITAEQSQSSDVKSRISSLQNQPAQIRQSAPSTRQSLEVSRPTLEPVDVIPRTGLSTNRSRPPSTNFDTSNTMEFLREREGLNVSRPQSRLQQPSPRLSPMVPSPKLVPTDDDALGEDRNLEFLRNMEASDGKHSHKRLTSLSGSKNILATKFGDAFKKFEGAVHLPHHLPHHHSGAQSSASHDQDHRRGLPPIAGSEATDGRSDDGQYHDESDVMSPEKRRSMERRKLDEEERRVEAAQAEYRKRVADGSTASDPSPLPRSVGGVPRALSIQNRVQSLLNEEQRSSSVPKTATGYGKYSDAATASASGKPEKPLPEVPRKAMSVPATQSRMAPTSSSTRSASPAQSPALPTRPNKPPAPKKPARLNSITSEQLPPSPTKPDISGQRRPGEQLIAVDLPGQPTLDMTAGEKDNYLQDFSQRFPSLSAMEGGGSR